MTGSWLGCTGRDPDESRLVLTPSGAPGGTPRWQAGVMPVLHHKALPIKFFMFLQHNSSNSKLLESSQPKPKYVCSNYYLNYCSVFPTTTRLHSSAMGPLCLYVTFSKEEEAFRCIQVVNGYLLNGRPLKASFGTTRYCHSLLKNLGRNLKRLWVAVGRMEAGRGLDEGWTGEGGGGGGGDCWEGIVEILMAGRGARQTEGFTELSGSETGDLDET
ncbi:hypothetical protein KSP39_PZI010961 [Platanthera zijinensis]|uniref:RRM domain-containing protein n=1 Tax=Platanthera zijinensis TaxID=2320716 RepID=A0AAP0BG73_9ASPA